MKLCKILSLVLVLVMLVSCFAACSTDSDTDTSKDASSSDTSNDASVGDTSNDTSVDDTSNDASVDDTSNDTSVEDTSNDTSSDDTSNDTLTDDEKKAWSVIGTVCGTNWDTDIALTADGENTWISEVLDLEAGQEFKIRQGRSWDVNFGADGAANGANIVVETTGKYQIKFVYDGTTASIELVAAE